MLTSFSTLIRLTLLVAVIFPAANLHAEIMVFTDRATWEAAAGAIKTEDFEQVAPQEVMAGPNFTFSEQRLGNISIGAKGDYLGADSNPTVRDAADQLSPNGTRHLGGVISNFEVIMQAVIIFDQPLTAFGADWASTTNRSGITLNIDQQTVDLADHFTDNGDGFLGLVADAPFREVFLTTRTFEEYGLDNLSYAVPEPSSVSYLLVILFIVIFFVCFRLRRSQGRI